MRLFSHFAGRSVAAALYVLILSVAGGCGSGGDGSADSTESEAGGGQYDSVMPDSFASDSLAETKDSLPSAPLRIRSKAEIDEFIASSPERSRYESGIIPTIAEYVPEYASKLLDNKLDGFLIVDKNTMRLYRYDKYGVEQESVGIACSARYGTKHARRDNRTPEGFFTIEGIYNSTDWLYTNDDGYTSPAKGQFGPRFMRLRTAVSSQIGIHGTAAPGSIGGRRSHGCIRMTNENIMRIHKLCKAGMPVIVSPGPRDMAVNESEGYYVPSVPVKPGGVPCKAGRISDYEREKADRQKNEAPKDSVAADSSKAVAETPAPAETVTVAPADTTAVSLPQ